MNLRTPLFAALVLSTAACVSRGTYDEAVRSGDDARAQLQHARAEGAQTAKTRDELQSKLDEQTAMNQGLKDELAKRGEDADKLLAEKGSLATALDDSRARLEQLRRAQAVSDLRARFFHDLAARLRGMVDAGDLAIVLRDGRMVLQLPNDVLFASGQVELQPRGRAAIKAIASVLATIPNRHFQVAGHTDNVPIDTDRFPSNWELSAARALEVTRVLVADGVRPANLSAAAYAEHDPVAPNASERDRARNRRIEITVQPNIDELVYVPAIR
jgi:chemotaxis protein MotB